MVGNQAVGAEVSEDREAPDSGSEGAGAGSDPAAVALALGSASRAEADAYLQSQRKLSDDQRHHLFEQMNSLRLSIWEKRMGVMLRVATAVMGLAFAGALAFFFHDAITSNRLLIDAFSVPPDLAARGITGEVVAARVLDAIAELQEQASTARAPQTFANNWGRNDIKVEIPETGISIGDLDRFLRERFSNDTHISGEVLHTAGGISLTARAGTQGSAHVTGSEIDLDALIGKLTEQIYGLTQPYRYGIYLESHGRVDEAVHVFSTLAKNGPAEEQPWGYVGWSNAIAAREGLQARARLLNAALAIKPDFIPANSNIIAVEKAQSHPEAEFRAGMKNAALFDTDAAKVFVDSPTRNSVQKKRYQVSSNALLGDFHNAASFFQGLVRQNRFSLGQTGLSAQLAAYYAGEHDLVAARATMDDRHQDSGVMPGISGLFDLEALMQIAYVAENWTNVLSYAERIEAAYAKSPGARSQFAAATIPMIAYAKAKLGRVSEAEKDLAVTPADCYECLIARAMVAELQAERGRADYWFGRATRSNPSIPFAYAEWGKASKERGDFTAAIGKFKLANAKGPHFADPLEGWGEALMAKNQSHLALAKFEEANKYAPNWGRLHLKWGEALIYAGKPDEAKAQFARASELELTPSEKAELARHS